MENSKNQLIARILSLRAKYRHKIVSAGRSTNSNNSSTEDSKDLFRKGTEFESFIVKRFNPEHFTLIEWRSDKNVDGLYPLMSRFPDLEFYYEQSSKCHQFAVECKWKEHFYKECIYLNDYQLENYRHYETVTGYPTFIIVGIGNTPSYPRNVYILPLREIIQARFHEFDLEVYRRPEPHNELNIKYQDNNFRLI